jgi:hypothetical protein
MLNINLLKNNIPNKIDIPKKSKLHIAKFLTVSLAFVLAIFLAIVAGFYFANRQAKIQTSSLSVKAQTKITKKKVERTTKNNNTFNITVKLQNAASNATVSNLQTHTNEPIAQEKSEVIALAPKIKQNANQNLRQTVSNPKPVSTAQPIKKSCTVFCNSNNLNYLKSILNQKRIPYTIKEQSENSHYYYVVFVGGLEKSKFLNFENILKSKGYNVVGTRVVNGTYYADLGRMNESDKYRFLAAWKNLGFDILVDKQKEMSNKSYEVSFLCTKDVFEDLRQKGFKANAGRGAAW